MAFIRINLKKKWFNVLIYYKAYGFIKTSLFIVKYIVLFTIRKSIKMIAKYNK